MTRLFYYDTSKIAYERLENYIPTLPKSMQDDILRFKLVSDKKARLIARLMVKYCLNDCGLADLINKWDRDANKKPFINGWDLFNISHSNDMVVFAHGNTAVGVDVEKNDISSLEIINYFHPEEKKFINLSKNPQKSFYEVWVKKESLLKAIGIGIINGLGEYNCTGEYVFLNEEKWNFHSFKIHPDYTCYLCTLSSESSVIVEDFDISRIR